MASRAAEAARALITARYDAYAIGNKVEFIEELNARLVCLRTLAVPSGNENLTAAHRQAVEEVSALVAALSLAACAVAMFATPDGDHSDIDPAGELLARALVGAEQSGLTL